MWQVNDADGLIAQSRVDCSSPFVAVLAEGSDVIVSVISFYHQMIKNILPKTSKKQSSTIYPRIVWG